MNGGTWFALGGLITLICIWILLEIGKKIKRSRVKKEVEFQSTGDKEFRAKLIGKMFDKPICNTCGQRFEKGSHWNVFGRTYNFCFRCGLEGETERFIKAEYARAGYGGGK